MPATHVSPNVVIVIVVRQLSPIDMTVVVVVVASNRRWGLSVPYRSIYNYPALVRLTIIIPGLI